jgi:hypothetical protein
MGCDFLSSIERGRLFPVNDSGSRLRGLKPPDRVTFSALAPLQGTPPAGCVCDNAAAATRTLQADGAPGGVAHDICTNDWTTALASVGPRAFGARASVPHTCTPAPSSTLEVRRNGVVVPSPPARGPASGATTRSSTPSPSSPPPRPPRAPA